MCSSRPFFIKASNLSYLYRGGIILFTSKLGSIRLKNADELNIHNLMKEEAIKI